ncbi:MAG: hypothetical protein K2O58_03285, partial [Bacteroidales bacterium]|nr:hypothetical protein [Bacteroidales bacterium]
GDIIMLFSDGLSGVLRDRKSCDREGNIIPGDNLEDIIRANRASMTECRKALWIAAENADWYDNVTAILCEIIEGKENKMIHTQDDYENGGSSKDKVNKSFINIRIHKKGLKIAGIVIAALLICTAAYFVGRKYIHANPHKDILIQMDSLQKKSVSLGLIFIYNQLNGLDRNKIDTSAFESIRKEFKERSFVLSELDSLSKRADSLGLSGSVAAISALKDSIRISETPEYNIQKLNTSIDLADSLQNQIRNFLEQYQNILSIKQKQQIESYRISLSEKEQIDKNDMKEWDKLSKQAIKGIQPIVNQAATARGEDKLEESRPSLTPAVDINF